MDNKSLVDELMNTKKVKSLGLKRESVVEILESYSDIALDKLLENGHVELGNGLIIEVVQLLERVHVLRGVTYKSSRKYKLKLTMEDKIYNRIEEYYNKLKEDIM